MKTEAAKSIKTKPTAAKRQRYSEEYVGQRSIARQSIRRSGYCATVGHRRIDTLRNGAQAMQHSRVGCGAGNAVVELGVIG